MRYGRWLIFSAAFIASPALALGGAASTAASSLEVAASAAVSAQGASPDSMTPQERQQLLDEIRALRDRVTALEGKAQAPVQTTPEFTPARKPGDHNLELYGFVQLVAIQDFDRVNPDWDATLRPSRIPTTKGEFGSDGQSVFSIRQSRLGAKATGTMAGKPYEAKFEFDLYGTGVDAGQTTIRIRHAYASWGPFLAGQTNSLFMDGDLFPNVVDYWGPAGMVFFRTPQLRWTFWNKHGWKAAVALEHATNDIDAGNLRLIDESIASSIRNDEKLPDATAQVRYEGKWGHVQLSGILRRLGYETLGTTGNVPRGHKTGWGVDLGASFNLALATIRVGAVYGRGIASYMNDGGMDFAPAVNVI